MRRRAIHILAGLVLAAGAAVAQDPPVLVQSRAAAPGEWLVSDWPAGQSGRIVWLPGNVRLSDGVVELVLDRSPAGSERPFSGGEIQSGTVAAEGTWRWRAQAPEMSPGAVFGMFLYRADYQRDPWREYDFEFVGADTTRVQLNVYAETAGGDAVNLGQARGGPVVVELGFDAAEGMHDYAITVTGREVVFAVDGREVGRFGPDDMPQGAWSPGNLRAFADLWAVAEAQEGWAGRWDWPGRPLVARIGAVEVPG
ncbi:family 16 glycosylhydrolase [Wenxinia saemankumensis]|uniref:Beta-glucanase n=1 Tax=Wenxinia saemankumensis TaxID=1447782 RepID=A0A1M5ZYD3_9RHOB|nr:family 16 glycosylhydrolase [Wenxinia saemankumensis]SHI29287.1 Glycosyl hydrolases family 16 [Wenxinia saemankumensis]